MTPFGTHYGPLLVGIYTLIVYNREKSMHAVAALFCVYTKGVSRYHGEGSNARVLSPTPAGPTGCRALQRVLNRGPEWGISRDPEVQIEGSKRVLPRY